MVMETDLRARIRQDAVVAAIVGGAVDWGNRTALPAVTLTMIGGPIGSHMQGPQRLQFARVQIDCWAETYVQAAELARAVLTASMPRATVGGTYFRQASATHPRDLGEQVSTGFIHRQQLDLTVRYSPA